MSCEPRRKEDRTGLWQRGGRGWPWGVGGAAALREGGGGHAAPRARFLKNSGRCPVPTRNCSAFIGPPNFKAVSPFFGKQRQGEGWRPLGSPSRRASPQAGQQVTLSLPEKGLQAPALPMLGKMVRKTMRRKRSPRESSEELGKGGSTVEGNRQEWRWREPPAPLQAGEIWGDQKYWVILSEPWS